MSTVKSISVGNGDMFYIVHNSSNFTQIDCNMCEENTDEIIEDIKSAKKGKEISRFISTHPDQDHFQGIKRLDDEIDILNFYCVDNDVPKDPETDDFKHYKKLRDDKKKAFHIHKGCSRKWMNEKSDERKSAGINVLWPDTSSQEFKDALKKANDGASANNISPIITYSVGNGAKVMWMGDLETDFMESIEDQVSWKKQNVLFVPHHGRKTGKVPDSILEKLDPDIVIIGEGPSEYLDYYSGYTSITQNSAKDIWLECSGKWIDIFVSAENYLVDGLVDRDLDDPDRNYVGSIDTSS